MNPRILLAALVAMVAAGCQSSSNADQYKVRKFPAASTSDPYKVRKFPPASTTDPYKVRTFPPAPAR